MELYIYDFSNDRKQQQRAIHTHCIADYKPNPYTVMKYISDRMYEQIRKTKSIAARHPLAMSLDLFFLIFIIAITVMIGQTIFNKLNAMLTAFPPVA